MPPTPLVCALQQLEPHLGTSTTATRADLTTTATTAIATHFPAFASYTSDITALLADYYHLTS